ncbi:hypothetical protein C1645_822504 [Glomus cerebriforme]|uniref:Cell division protein ZapB n=1 Tax=Glomus cerebriforme TaxID=658196 RepID=A0A397T7V9_9GLOM|nr:hypothetical protein C1645_822504 [Glomus cerebriforme]
MSNTQIIDSLRELNVKLLAEIAELRKENAEVEAKKLEKNSAITTKFESENSRLKAEIAKLKYSIIR